VRAWLSALKKPPPGRRRTASAAARPGLVTLATTENAAFQALVALALALG
jgi:hypothetical protein